MVSYLEHANITVPDIDAAIRFLKLVDPDFEVRHDGKSETDNIRWAHIGNQQFYIALQEPYESEGEKQSARPYHDFVVNHLGWVIEDFDEAVERLEQAGYQRGIPVAPHPARKRAYYFDDAGFEWEILGYLTDKAEDRNAYE